jgi:hypothetical protein
MKNCQPSWTMLAFLLCTIFTICCSILAQFSCQTLRSSFFLGGRTVSSWWGRTASHTPNTGQHRPTQVVLPPTVFLTSRGLTLVIWSSDHFKSLDDTSGLMLTYFNIPQPCFRYIWASTPFVRSGVRSHTSVRSQRFTVSPNDPPNLLLLVVTNLLPPNLICYRLNKKATYQ